MTRFVTLVFLLICLCVVQIDCGLRTLTDGSQHYITYINNNCDSTGCDRNVYQAKTDGPSQTVINNNH